MPLKQNLAKALGFEEIPPPGAADTVIHRHECNNMFFRGRWCYCTCGLPCWECQYLKEEE